MKRLDPSSMSATSLALLFLSFLITVGRGCCLAVGLSAAQRSNIVQYAEGMTRYFTSPQSNNKTVGLTHSWFGTGLAKGGPLQRQDGSDVVLNEATLGFVCLAAA